MKELQELRNEVLSLRNMGELTKQTESILLHKLNTLQEAINYTRCCKSGSELLPDAEKEKLIEDAYFLNLQNLSGREDFEKAFRLGIETGVDETLEKLQG